MCDHVKCPVCIHCIKCDAWMGKVSRETGRACDNHLRCSGCGCEMKTYDVLNMGGSAIAAVACGKCGRIAFFDAESSLLKRLYCRFNAFLTGC